MRYQIDVSKEGERLFTAEPGQSELPAATELYGLFVAGKFTEADGYKVEVFEIAAQRLPVKSVHPTYDRVFYVKLADQIVYGSPAMPNHDFDRPTLVDELIREIKVVFGSYLPTRACEIADKVTTFLLEHDYELMILFFRAALDSSKHGHQPMAAAFGEITKRRLGPMLMPNDR